MLTVTICVADKPVQILARQHRELGFQKRKKSSLCRLYKEYGLRCVELTCDPSGILHHFCKRQNLSLAFLSLNISHFKSPNK